jgi:hypothetical protein
MRWAGYDSTDVKRMDRGILSRIALCLSLGAAIGVSAQSPEIRIHPNTADLAGALETVDVVLTRIEAPLTALSSDAYGEPVAGAWHERLKANRKLSRQWAGLLTVSSGKEMPSASDLFTIYIEVTDMQSYMSSLTNDEKLRGKDLNLIQAATAVIRAETELIPTTQTIEFAVGDRIDAQQAACSPRQPAPKHK